MLVLITKDLSGLELQYDDYLTGKSGAIKYFSDAKGNKLNSIGYLCRATRWNEYLSNYRYQYSKVSRARTR